MTSNKTEQFVSKIKKTEVIDRTSWKEFVIGKNFDCDTANQTLKVEDGTSPYVTRSSFNNGISRYVKKINNKINKKNCITIGAEGFVAFYQNKDFMAGNKIYVLRHPKLNEFNALFICSILNSISNKYSYSNARILNKIKTETHLFPVNSKGELDWDYMEKFVKNSITTLNKSKQDKLNKTYNEIKNQKNIDTSTWKEFYLCGEKGIFELKNSVSKIHNKNIRGEFGEIPYITRTDSNNGVARYIQKQNVEINKGNCLTIGMDAITIFYQENDFYTGDKIKILRNSNLNKLNSLFIISVIYKFFKANFSWGEKSLNFKELNQLKIKLPAKNNNPDWKFMENYIEKKYNRIKTILK